MNYNRIFDKIDEMVKTEYPKNYKVKVVFNQEKTFNGFTELTIELVDEDYNKVIYHKYLKEINLEIQKIGFSKYITNLKHSLTKEEFKEIEDGIKVQLALNDKKEAKNAEKTQKNQEKSGFFVRFFQKIKNLFKKEKENEEERN